LATAASRGIIYGEAADTCGCANLEATITSQQPKRDTLQHVLKKLHTGVVVHAPDTQVVYANLRAAELLGLSEAQMLGKTLIDPVWQFVDGVGRRIDPPQYPVSQVLTSGQALKATDFGVIAPPRDHITWLSVTAFPEFDDAGQIERVVVSFHDISVLKQAQADFERARTFALSVLDGLSALVCVLDMHGTILAVNRSWREFYVANGGEVGAVHVGVNYLQVAGAASSASDQPDGAASFKELLEHVLAGERDHFEWEYPCHSPTTKRWFIARVSSMKGVQPMRVVVAHDDITAVKQAQESAREALLFSQNLIDSMQDGFSVLDHTGRATHANPALCRMTGFSADELIGQVAPFPYWPPEEYQSIEAAFRKTLQAEGGEFELVFMRKSRERFHVVVAASAVLDERGQPVAYLATVKDQTRLKRMEDEITRLAFYDALTELPNRRLFEDRLERAEAAATRGNRHGAVVLIDLDGFKVINDVHGHQAGDRLLVEVGLRLKACVREVDTAARLGGDEFVVILDGLGGEETDVIETARKVAEKIRAALAQPYQLTVEHTPDPVPHAVTCTASIGVAMFAGVGLRAVEALRVADMAMYEAKRSGGNKVETAP
jgi:diguanylate cyclase (GGDEF)-like protein/PAS domain S-box-containing protein